MRRSDARAAGPEHLAGARGRSADEVRGRPAGQLVANPPTARGVARTGEAPSAQVIAGASDRRTGASQASRNLSTQRRRRVRPPCGACLRPGVCPCARGAGAGVSPAGARPLTLVHCRAPAAGLGERSRPAVAADPLWLRSTDEAHHLIGRAIAIVTPRCRFNAEEDLHFRSHAARARGRHKRRGRSFAIRASADDGAQVAQLPFRRLACCSVRSVSWAPVSCVSW